MNTLASMHHLPFNRLQVLGIAFAVGLVLSASARPAAACSCLQPSVESSYNNSEDVVTARVLFAFAQGGERWHLAQVRQVYKGCLGAPDLVLLTTPDSSAACGVSLQAGVSYLINARPGGAFLGIPKLGIGLCDYNLPVSELTDHDREFLNGRSVCCGSECGCADGSQPVQCFADPCSVTPACPEAATCVANYCGGCNAEFYDSNGGAACQGPTGGCSTDADCQVTGCSGQVCASEPVITTCEFREEYACYQDPAITTCGCQTGRCDWADTAELAECLTSFSSAP